MAGTIIQGNSYGSPIQQSLMRISDDYAVYNNGNMNPMLGLNSGYSPYNSGIGFGGFGGYGNFGSRGYDESLLYGGVDPNKFQGYINDATKNYEALNDPSRYNSVGTARENKYNDLKKANESQNGYIKSAEVNGFTTQIEANREKYTQAGLNQKEMYRIRTQNDISFKALPFADKMKVDKIKKALEAEATNKAEEAIDEYKEYIVKTYPQLKDNADAVNAYIQEQYSKYSGSDYEKDVTETGNFFSSLSRSLGVAVDNKKGKSDVTPNQLLDKVGLATVTGRFDLMDEMPIIGTLRNFIAGIFN